MRSIIQFDICLNALLTKRFQIKTGSVIHSIMNFQSTFHGQLLSFLAWEVFVVQHFSTCSLALHGQKRLYYNRKDNLKFDKRSYLHFHPCEDITGRLFSYVIYSLTLIQIAEVIHLMFCVRRLGWKS